jgi:DNA repair protein RecN (Recombination protein N)
VLSRVEITDFALIEHIILSPSPGLTVISGETGAGKSILIDAIGALTGQRASRDFVRTGSEKAKIEAVMIKHDPADDKDFTSDCDQVLLSRTIFAQGGSECRIDGHLVKLSELKQIGERLISIHGQYDNQIIFREKEHLELLDAYGKADIEPLLATYESLRKQWLITVEAIAILGNNPQERTRQLEILRYQANEIRTANIKSGEEDDLKQRARILGAKERILHDLETVHHILGQDDEQAIGSLLQRALETLDYSSHYSKKLKSSRDRLLHLTSEIAEIKTELLDYVRRLDIDSAELLLIQDRIDLINELKRKYGSDETEILAFAAKAEDEIERLQASAEDFSRLKEKQRSLDIELKEIAEQLHKERLMQAKELDEAIKNELLDLDMPHVQFVTKVEEAVQANDLASRWPDKGTDNISFMISPNLGEPLKPLAQIASGGEASRVLLAIKTVLASVDKIPVLIFDEIDSGISGKTTDSIAQKLKTIAESCQVLCVTHSAQIAARADTHYLISKKTHSGRTSTKLEILEAEYRIDEISRLLSGQPSDPVSRKLAEQLLSRH